MAEQEVQPKRMVSMVITIILDAVPNDETPALEEQALQVGDEWGARVNISKAEARGVLPQV